MKKNLFRKQLESLTKQKEKVLRKSAASPLKDITSFLVKKTTTNFTHIITENSLNYSIFIMEKNMF